VSLMELEYADPLAADEGSDEEEAGFGGQPWGIGRTIVSLDLTDAEVAAMDDETVDGDRSPAMAKLMARFNLDDADVGSRPIAFLVYRSPGSGGGGWLAEQVGG
jgi:hypothetical protein